MRAPIAPHAAIDQFLNALRPPARILVAISGGSDSTGLLHLLDDALTEKPRDKITLVAATVDHDLRAGSAAEAEAVARLCAERGIPHSIKRWQGEKPLTGISEAARLKRHALLAEAARDLSADLVVTGHTLDDQRETILMRAARGDRPDAIGLSGMAPATLYDRSTWFVRPLLVCRREDIRASLADAGIPWIDDPSNDDRRFERVRVRQGLAAADTLLGDDARADDRRHLAEAAAVLVRTHVTGFRGPLVRVASDVTKADTRALAYMLAHLLMATGGRSHVPPQPMLEPLLDALTAMRDHGHRSRITLARCLVDIGEDGIFILRERRGILPLTLEPGSTGLWDGRFRITNRGPVPVTITTGGAEIDRQGDADRLSSPLVPPEIPGKTGPDAYRTLIQATAPRALSSGPVEGQIPPLETLECEPALGGFDLFLPDFDLPLADALAPVFGRSAYLTPPI